MPSLQSLLDASKVDLCTKHIITRHANWLTLISGDGGDGGGVTISHKQPTVVQLCGRISSSCCGLTVVSTYQLKGSQA